MAMNGNQLGQEIAEIITHSDAPPEVKAQVLTLWQKIGTAIVDHIKTNAVVPAGIPTQSGGNTTGPGKVQ